MRLRPRAWILLFFVAWCVATLSLQPGAQRGGQFMGSADDPAIAYSTAPVSNVVDDLNRRLQDGSAALTFEGRAGYLQSVIDALRLPTDSQLLVFSKGSLQARQISPSNPRALYFNDRVALGWVRDAELIEVAAHDAKLGMVFYTLEQRPESRPVFKREFRCLGCHVTGDTLGVPGLLMFSTRVDPADQHATVTVMDQRIPLTARWGGWFVTGSSGSGRHMGNQAPALQGASDAARSSVAGLFEPDGYRTMSSDIVALLTFSHQTHMTNLLTRAAWEARAADPAEHPQAPASPGRSSSDRRQPTALPLVESMMRGIADEVVDYMLFVDEAPLPDAVSGPSGFSERQAASGPRDRQGRSLYELDLNKRLMKYPCSYLIYSPAFDALPPLAKAPIYRRMWDVLSG
ncbi:MAG: hypothetical protein ABMA15_27560, partial [Vicinamibacterales bacterium]